MKLKITLLTSFVTAYQYVIILGLVTLFLAYVIAVAIAKARSNFPPGPMGLPIVGYLPFMSKDMHLDLLKLGEKYGDVFRLVSDFSLLSIRLGSQILVILYGGDAIKEAFHKPEFLGRPPNSAFVKFSPSSAFFGGRYDLWKEQRRFVVQSMKELGLGKTKIEEDVMDEIHHLMDVLRSHNSQPIDPKEPFTPSMSNNIYALVFGRRLQYDSPDRRFLDNCLEEVTRNYSQISLDEFFPWLLYIPFVSKFLQGPKTNALFEKLKNFFENELKEHLKTFDHSHMRDFMDRYLLEIDTQRAKNPNTTFNNNMLMSNLVDIFIAGSETTRSSFLWFIYVMAAFPEVQKKIQEEIQDVIGSEKIPEYMDIRNMPYTHAVMMEIMRWKTIVPLNLMHYTLADTTVGGYSLPKGTTVIANFWAVHHDPRYWNEPNKFKPERFLGEDGKSVVKPSYFMPFSLGKRLCPGESMAYLELFLYFTSILREFDIVFSNKTEPTFDAKYFITYNVESYLVRFIQKN